MNSRHLMIISSLCGLLGSAPGDEVKIKFPKEVNEAFGEQIPLEIKAIRIDGEVKIQLENVSSKHVVVTKHAHHSSGHYLASDGSKLEEYGNFIPAIPKEFFDHVVLKPHKERENGLSFSSWEIMKFSTKHKESSVFVFDSALSGYFPTIDRYLDFFVIGRVNLETKDHQKDIADKPAPNSKPEGVVKPESGDRQNSPKKE